MTSNMGQYANPSGLEETPKLVGSTLNFNFKENIRIAKEKLLPIVDELLKTPTNDEALRLGHYLTIQQFEEAIWAAEIIRSAYRICFNSDRNKMHDKPTYFNARRKHVSINLRREVYVDTSMLLELIELNQMLEDVMSEMQEKVDISDPDIAGSWVQTDPISESSLGLPLKSNNNDLDDSNNIVVRLSEQFFNDFMHTGKNELSPVYRPNKFIVMSSQTNENKNFGSGLLPPLSEERSGNDITNEIEPTDHGDHSIHNNQSAKSVVVKCISDLDRVKDYLSTDMIDVGLMTDQSPESPDSEDPTTTDDLTDTMRSSDEKVSVESVNRVLTSNDIRDPSNLDNGKKKSKSESFKRIGSSRKNVNQTENNANKNCCCGVCPADDGIPICDDNTSKIMICIQGRNEEDKVHIIIKQCADNKSKDESVYMKQKETPPTEPATSQTDEIPSKEEIVPKKQVSSKRLLLEDMQMMPTDPVNSSFPEVKPERFERLMSTSDHDTETIILHNIDSKGDPICSSSSGEDDLASARQLLQSMDKKSGVVPNINVIYNVNDPGKSVVRSQSSRTWYKSQSRIDCSRMILNEPVNLCLNTETGEELLVSLTIRTKPSAAQPSFSNFFNEEEPDIQETIFAEEPVFEEEQVDQEVSAYQEEAVYEEVQEETYEERVVEHVNEDIEESTEDPHVVMSRTFSRNIVPAVEQTMHKSISRDLLASVTPSRSKSRLNDGFTQPSLSRQMSFIRTQTKSTQTSFECLDRATLERELLESPTREISKIFKQKLDDDKVVTKEVTIRTFRDGENVVTETTEEIREEKDTSVFPSKSIIKSKSRIEKDMSKSGVLSTKSFKFDSEPVFAPPPIPSRSQSIQSQLGPIRSASRSPTKSETGASRPPSYVQSEKGASQTPSYIKSEIGTSRSPSNTKSEIGASRPPSYVQSEKGASQTPSYTKSEIGTSRSPSYIKSEIGASHTPSYAKSEIGANRTTSYVKSEMAASQTPSYVKSEKGVSRTPSYIKSEIGASRSPSYAKSQMGASRAPSYVKSEIGASRTPSGKGSSPTPSYIRSVSRSPSYVKSEIVPSRAPSYVKSELIRVDNIEEETQIEKTNLEGQLYAIPSPSGNVIKSQESQLQSRESQLQSRESQLKSRESQLRSRESQLQSRESQLKSRESQLECRESHLESRASQLVREPSAIPMRSEIVRSRSSQMRRASRQSASENPMVPSRQASSQTPSYARLESVSVGSPSQKKSLHRRSSTQFETPGTTPSQLQPKGSEKDLHRRSSLINRSRPASRSRSLDQILLERSKSNQGMDEFPSKMSLMPAEIEKQSSVNVTPDQESRKTIISRTTLRDGGMVTEVIDEVTQPLPNEQELVLKVSRSRYYEPPEDRIIPLSRTKICSSIEFDVTVVDTKLRTQQIDNNNPRIIVRLNDLGVDNLLRACRPAKCCRRAILGEKNKKCLPYSASLRSLPLNDSDVTIIKQSIDMNVQKVKNSTNLRKGRKENSNLSYYILLENTNPDSTYSNNITQWTIRNHHIGYLTAVTYNYDYYKHKLYYYINLVSDMEENILNNVVYEVMYFEMVNSKQLKVPLEHANNNRNDNNSSSSSVIKKQKCSTNFPQVDKKDHSNKYVEIYKKKEKFNRSRIPVYKKREQVKTKREKYGEEEEILILNLDHFSSEDQNINSRDERNSIFNSLPGLFPCKQQILSDNKLNSQRSVEEFSCTDSFEQSLNVFCRTIEPSKHSVALSAKKSHFPTFKTKRKKPEFYLSRSRSEISFETNNTSVVCDTLYTNKVSCKKRSRVIKRNPTDAGDTNENFKDKSSKLNIHECSDVIVDYLATLLYEIILNKLKEHGANVEHLIDKPKEILPRFRNTSIQTDNKEAVNSSSPVNRPNFLRKAKNYHDIFQSDKFTEAKSSYLKFHDKQVFVTSRNFDANLVKLSEALQTSIVNMNSNKHCQFPECPLPKHKHFQTDQKESIKTRVFPSKFKDKEALLGVNSIKDSCDKFENFIVVFKSDESVNKQRSEEKVASMLNCLSATSTATVNEKSISSSLLKLKETLAEYEKSTRNNKTEFRKNENCNVSPMEYFVYQNNNHSKSVYDNIRDFLCTNNNIKASKNVCTKCGCYDMRKCPGKSATPGVCCCPAEKRRAPPTKKKKKHHASMSKSRCSVKKSFSSIFGRSKGATADLCACSKIKKNRGTGSLCLPPNAEVVPCPRKVSDQTQTTCECNQCESFDNDGMCRCSHCVGLYDKSVDTTLQNADLESLCKCFKLMRDNKATPGQVLSSSKRDLASQSSSPFKSFAKTTSNSSYTKVNVDPEPTNSQIISPTGSNNPDGKTIYTSTKYVMLTPSGGIQKEDPISKSDTRIQSVSSRQDTTTDQEYSADETLQQYSVMVPPPVMFQDIRESCFMEPRGGDHQNCWVSNITVLTDAGELGADNGINYDVLDNLLKVFLDHPNSRS